MKIHESGENYLETILLLNKRNQSVRAIDVANELNYSKPSVSRALGLLKENGYIIIDNNFISLTEKGIAKANSVYQRHIHITNFLISTLGVDKTTAELDACKIEHIISEKTFNLIKGKY